MFTSEKNLTSKMAEFKGVIKLEVLDKGVNNSKNLELLILDAHNKSYDFLCKVT